MKKIYIDDNVKNGLKTQVVGSDFYKRNWETDIIEVVNRLRKNEHLFNLDVLALPKAYLYYKKDMYGVVLEYLEDYRTVFEYLNNLKKFDVYTVIDIVIDTILKMESIGILYYDLHFRNVMLRGTDEVKLVDLDDAIIKTEFDDYLISRKCMLEFIFGAYINIYTNQKEIEKYCDSSSILRLIPKKIFLTDYFSKEFVEYFYLIYYHDMEANDVDFRGVLKEVNDPEKMDNIRKKILAI